MVDSSSVAGPDDVAAVAPSESAQIEEMEASSSPAQPPKAAPHSRPNWWTRAILASLTGLSLSVALSLIVAIGLTFRFSPMVALDRVGSELGMRVFWAASPFLQIKDGGGASFVFLDVDETTCRRYRPEVPDRCRVDNPISAKLAADAIKWARQSGAAGIILDVAPFSDKGDRDLVRRAASGPGPWVIAPMAGRADLSGGRLIFNRNPAEDLIPSMSLGSLRLAAFEAGRGDAAEDGIVRRYARWIPTRLPGQSSPSCWAPSVAYLASVLSGLRRAQTLDTGPIIVNCRGQWRPTPDSQQDGYLGARVAFSLPSLSVPRPEDQQGRLEVRYYPVYARILSSELQSPTGGGLSLDSHRVRGRIVLIGSSAMVAQDWVVTPIGPMPGAELLINATRGFGLSDASAPNDGLGFIWEDFASKVVAGLRGAAIMTLAWLAVFAVWRWAERKGAHIRVPASLGVAVLFLAGVASAGVVELVFLARETGAGLFHGHFVDVLTPMIALGLEGYTHAVATLIKRIEHILAKLPGTLMRANPFHATGAH